MKLKAVIIDDEKQARASLAEDISLHCPEIYLAGEADSVSSGIEILTSLSPDVVFLDINLGDGTGFDLLAALPDRQFRVVFVTAYDEYAIKAFRFSALDYLLKPVLSDQLKEVVRRVNEDSGAISETVSALQALIGRSQEPRIPVPTSSGIHIFKIAEIIRCESDGNYSRLYPEGGDKLLTSRTLKDFEELLSPYHFERVHSSHLVNMNHVVKYSHKDGGYLIMSDDATIPVSQRKKSYILELIRNLH